MLIMLSDPVGKKKLNQKARRISELRVWTLVYQLSEGIMVTCVVRDCGTEMSHSVTSLCHVP